MKRKFNHLLLMFMGLMLASNVAFAQTTIRGTVTDDTGEALIGANVIVKGTDNGDVTDIDGNYSISTSGSFPLTLVFSYTGFTTQEVAVTSSAPVNVTLAEGVISEEIVISASRRREKVQEAPASISVITARKLESTANGTDPTRNLISTAGVQIQQQSANRINISMRGSAGLFGTSAFPIMDYRSLVGPGIGTFQSDAAGISNIDLERIEVVRGPGSALYGPGVTQGVIHFITKSPIDYPCTTVELLGGELQTFGASARHATKVSDKFGFKVNATYRQGNEFTLDPDDPDDAVQIAKFFHVDTDMDGINDLARIVQPAVNGNIVDVTGTPTTLLTQAELDPDGDGNMMAEDWHNLGINATLEFRPKDNLSIVTSGGFNNARSVFYNEQGEGLAQASEYWGQARMQAGGLFAQVFGVVNDGGTEENPTFLYQTGNRTPVGRTQLEAQLQYNWDMKNLLNSNWTAGFDYRFAGQDTENLVYGRNEDDDDFSVIGGYVQGKFELGKKLDLVVAGRYDQFNFIDEGAFAPRAALVYKVNPKHTFRASYNRANSTVSNLQLNVDFPLQTIIPGSFDIWLYGNKTTQTFENAAIKWFNPALPDLPVGTPGLPMAVPYGAVASTVNAGLLAFVMNDPNLSPLASIFEAALGSIDPSQMGFVGAFSPGFNIFNNSPLGLTDAPISKISTLDAFEIGYKGLINDKLGVTFDIYQNTQKNFSQFTAISPAYIYGGYEGLPGELGAAVGAQFGPALEAGLAGAGLPQAQIDAIMAGVLPAVIGGYTQGGDTFLNGPSGGPGTATPSIAQILGALPFHATVPTDQVPGTGGTHLAAGYRTFTERSYLGADLGLEYYFTGDFSAFFNYSWISDNSFMHKVSGDENGPDLPSYLNIPKNKFRTGITYTPEVGFRGSLSFQHDDSYFADAGQYTGDTEERNLVDASIGYKFNNGLAIDLSATNVFNNEYRYLPNMPKIGRRALAKLVYNIGCGNSVKKPKMAKADRDGDGIRDSKDRCPDIAGIKKHKGCPMSEADMAAQAAEEARMAAEAKAKAEAEAKARAEEEARMAAEAKAKAEAEAEAQRVAAAKAAEEAKLAAEKAAAEAKAATPTAPQMGSGAMTHTHNGVSHSHANSGDHVHVAENAVTGVASAADYKKGSGAYTHSHAGIGTHSHDNDGDHEHASVSEVSTAFNAAMKGINFRSGQDRFRSASYAIMDNVVSVLKSNPNMTVTIEGHTDSQGGSASNKTLSQQRADAVKAYLVSKGISSNRMTAIGYGEERPMADNNTSAGRAQNRRVVFIPNN